MSGSHRLVLSLHLFVIVICLFVSRVKGDCKFFAAKGSGVVTVKPPHASDGKEVFDNMNHPASLL